MKEQLIVVKFGGTSLGTPARIRRAADRITVLAEEMAVVAVVSATGATTDRALNWIERVGGRGRKHEREWDRALATGEDFSAAVLAATLKMRGSDAISLRGGEAGLTARGPFGRSDLEGVDPTPIREALRAGRIPVVAGFQAVRADGETVTLGRGGSDLTAVALAVALGAVECHLVTDVPGVFDRDPAVSADAVRIPLLTHADLCALVAPVPADGAAGDQSVIQAGAARRAAAAALPLRIYDHRAPFRAPSGSRVARAAAGRVA